MVVCKRTDELLGGVRAQSAFDPARFGLWVVCGAICVAVTLSPWRSGNVDKPSRGAGDIALYQAEVEQMRSGESYYVVARRELINRGFATQSVFNWRTPWLLWTIAQVGIKPAQALLALAALATFFGSFDLLARQYGMRAAIVTAVFLAGALMPCCLEDACFMSEVWAGIFVAASVIAFNRERNRTGVALGLAALVIRELAAPYVLLCMAIAAWNRRGRELAAWSAGLAVYSAMYGWHLAQLAGVMEPGAAKSGSNWLVLGGLPFVLATTQMNLFLLLLPQWATALYWTAAMAGMSRWNTPEGIRASLTSGLYCVAFATVGCDFNQYWGSMTAPVLCLPAAVGAEWLCRQTDAGARLLRATLFSPGAAARPT